MPAVQRAVEVIIVLLFFLESGKGSDCQGKQKRQELTPIREKDHVSG
jgi:hypothetical protein